MWGYTRWMYGFSFRSEGYDMKFWVVRNRFFPFFYLGIVLWPFVFIRPCTRANKFKTRSDVILFRHELEHCYQIHKEGVVKFYFNYLKDLIKHGYKNHPKEIQARTAERNFLTQRESEWYRSGKINISITDRIVSE